MAGLWLSHHLGNGITSQLLLTPSFFRGVGWNHQPAMKSLNDCHFAVFFLVVRKVMMKFQLCSIRQVGWAQSRACWLFSGLTPPTGFSPPGSNQYDHRIWRRFSDRIWPINKQGDMTDIEVIEPSLWVMDGRYGIYEFVQKWCMSNVGRHKTANNWNT